MDILGLTYSAYRLMAAERRYLLRIATVPIIVKLLCAAAVAAYGYDTNFIRQALIMLPSYFLDGWLVAHVARFALFGQHWPFREAVGRETVGKGRTRSIIHVIRDRAVGIMAGTITYATVRFLSMGCLALLNLAALWLRAHQGTPAHPTLIQPWASLALAGSLAVVALAVWAIRLQFLYIAASANVSLRRFIVALGGLNVSFPLVGVWIACALPVLLAMTLATALIIAPFGGKDAFGQAGPTFMLIAVWSLADTAIEILTSLAVSRGLKPYLAKAMTS